MFLTSDYGPHGPLYNRAGEQTARGLFLMLFSPDCGKTLYAAVRHVRMRQSGHWMIGSAQVGRTRVHLSGAYGSDGLTLDPPAHDLTCASLVRVPDTLRDAWNTGGGWNSAGNEGPTMRQWALKNMEALRSAGRVK